MKLSNALVTLLIILGDCPLLSSIMDEYLQSRYQVLKRPSRNLQIFHQQTLKADQTKQTASIVAMWLKERDESTFLNCIEVKLAEGYQISMFPVWQLLDKQGNILEERIEPQHGSARRPWKRVWIQGMMNTKGKKWRLKE